MAMAYTQTWSLRFPAPRFYIVLQNRSRAKSPDLDAGRSRTNIANAEGQALPTAAELRELVALKANSTECIGKWLRRDIGPLPPQQ